MISEVEKKNSNYQMTKLGMLPTEWKVSKLYDEIENVLDFRGRTPKKLGMDWGNGNIAALSANNVKMGYIDFNAECYLASEELYEKWMTKGDLKKGDVLMTMEAPLGKVAQVPDNNKYILSQRVIALKSKRTLLNVYLKYYLMSDLFQSMLEKNATGTTAKGINQKNLSKLEIIVPSLNEQQKIAEILSAADEQIEKNEQLIEKTKELKKGLIKQLLKKGIGHSDFKESEIGEIPFKWSVKTFEDVMVLQRGFDLPVQNRIEGDIPIVSANGISGFHNELKIKAPGIITGRSGTIGKVHFIERDYWPLNTALYVKETYNNDPKFLYYFLSEFKLERFSTGTGVPTLNRNNVHRIKIAIPEVKEQRKIAEILSSVDNQIEVCENLKEKQIELKKALMQQLLTGKIRVTV